MSYTTLVKDKYCNAGPENTTIRCSSKDFANGESEASISVYLVNAREYVEVDERRLKDVVRDVGGRWNQSCQFCR